MEYIDKKIIELRNTVDNLKDKDITKKVLIKGEEFEFEEIKLFDDKVSITLPKVFDCAVYNINFGAAIDNKLFIGTFDCNVVDVSDRFRFYGSSRILCDSCYRFSSSS